MKHTRTTHRSMALLLFLFILSANMQGQNSVSWTFMPQWTPQAQFAGYYVAYEKGFFKEEGIDLTIEHTSVNSSTPVIEELLSNHVQIITQQLLQSIKFRSRGNKIVNILQTSQSNGLMCVSHHKLGSPNDLNNLKIGRWKSGYSELSEIIENDYRLKIEWIPFLQSIHLYISNAIDATLCYSYNEYNTLLFSLGTIPEENILRFSNIGYNYPEDGIYVTEKFYNANKEKLQQFVKAVKRGWDYAREHRDEALEISLQYTKRDNIATNRFHQKLMLEETLRLQVNPKTKKADYAPVTYDIFNDMNTRMQRSGLIVSPITYNDLIK